MTDDKKPTPGEGSEGKPHRSPVGQGNAPLPDTHGNHGTRASTPRPAPLVVPGVTAWEKITAALIGFLILGVVLFGVSKMGGRISQNTLTGTIVEKVHTPYHEEQFTLGRKGVDSRKKDGDYELRVAVKGREYIVPVYKEIYEAKKKGESFTFPRPN